MISTKKRKINISLINQTFINKKQRRTNTNGEYLQNRFGKKTHRQIPILQNTRWIQNRYAVVYLN